MRACALPEFATLFYGDGDRLHDHVHGSGGHRVSGAHDSERPGVLARDHGMDLERVPVGYALFQIPAGGSATALDRVVRWGSSSPSGAFHLGDSTFLNAASMACSASFSARERPERFRPRLDPCPGGCFRRTRLCAGPDACGIRLGAASLHPGGVPDRDYGWRAAFMLLGARIGWAVFWFRWYRDTLRSTPGQCSGARTDPLVAGAFRSATSRSVPWSRSCAIPISGCCR